MNERREPFSADAFIDLASIENFSWWFRARNKILIWAIQKHTYHLDNFLEIGCGNGYVLEAISKSFPNIKLHADEYFEEGLIHARKRVPQALFRLLDATKMQDTNSFDAIGAFDVIEHIENDRLVLNNISAALKKEGYILLTVPQHKWMWSKADEHAFHVRRYSKSELIKKLKNAGFKTIYTTSFITFLLPFMYISRLGLRKKNFNPMKEFKISRWLNKIFESIMYLEHFFLKLGIRFPFGGSLLVIAKKL